MSDLPTISADNIQASHLAIVGGTFDPVHIGHMRVAIEVRTLGFEQVLMMPNRIPAHKPQPIASPNQRLDMLTLASSELEGIKPSAFELEHPDTSFTAETLARLKRAMPNTALTWVIGMDSWLSLHLWHQPEAMLEHGNILVVNRPPYQHDKHDSHPWQTSMLNTHGVDLADLIRRAQGAISFMDIPALDICASHLRKAIAQGDNIDFLVPDGVRNYIHQQQLYS